MGKKLLPVRSVAGNQPLLLLPDENWIVESGVANLFAVPLDMEKPSGSRMFLCSIKTGELLPGVLLRNRHPKIGFLITGTPETTVRSVQIKTVIAEKGADIHRDVLLEQLDDWISDLFSGYTRHFEHRECSSKEILHHPSGKTDVAAGSSIRPDGEFPWYRVVKGSGLFSGLEKWVISQGSEFPLPPGSWFSATEDVIIEKVDLANHDDELIDVATEFTSLILDLLISSCEERLNQENKAEALKESFWTSVYDSALERLSDVFSFTSTDEEADTEDAGPFLNVCRIIGRYSGITFQTPPNQSLNDYDDPVDILCRTTGVRSRQIALNKDSVWWCNMITPLLCMRKDGSVPVAVIPDKRNGSILHDPTRGEVLPMDETVAATLEDVAWMFYPALPHRSVSGKDLLSFALIGTKSDIALLFFLGFGASLLGLLSPVLTGILFDSIIPQAMHGQLMQLVIILLVSTLAVAGFNLVREFVVVRIQSRMDVNVQAAIMDRLLKMPGGFYRRYSSGDLSDRVMGISEIRDALGSAVVNALFSGMFGLTSFLLLFYYSWKLALVALGLSLIMAVVTLVLGIRRLEPLRACADTQGSLSTLLGELLGGIGKIRVTGTETLAFARWATLFSRQRQEIFRAGTAQNMLTVFQSSFPVLAIAAIYLFSSQMISGNMINTGAFIAFVAAYSGFQGALMQMVMEGLQNMHIIPLYERLKPIIDTPPEMDDNRAHFGKLKGHIDLQNVNFSYGPDQPQILYDVSLEAKPGEFIALVGGSGSGKSTLLNILLGFEVASSGSVYFDGMDMADMNLHELRRQVGVVIQNGDLQPGFVLQNIIGTSTLTIDDGWEAARLAGFDDDIKNMPMGMYTFISEGGGGLSGGQRQRMLIARALVRKPRLIFFDEATSALDNHTQAIVSKSLESLNATRIVIAHRLSTIRNADRIYCLDKGRIVQSGTYDELMSQEGFFKELARRQIA